MQAILITFCINSSRFRSAYERNMFYRELYGWKQITRKTYGRYEYQKDGLLDSIPYIKVDKSLIIITVESLSKLKSFFKDWKNKIKYSEFTIQLNPKDIERFKNMDCKYNNIDYFIKSSR